MLVSNSDNSERGSFLTIAIFILPLLLIFTALLIDTLLLERIGRSLQRTADAAALAGALELRPEITDVDQQRLGWLRAKRATFALLRNNDIFGDDDSIRTAATFGMTSGTVDQQDDPAEPYKFTNFQFPNLEVIIERGIWWDDGSGTMVFDTMETGTSDCPPGIWVCSGGFNYQFANAVRVRLKLPSAKTFFSVNAFGLGEVQNIHREAVAAPD